MRRCNVIASAVVSASVYQGLRVSPTSHTLFEQKQVLLHYAAYFGLFKDVEWLLEKGAQVDVYDQMSIQDFRFTIMDPPKQELWSQLQKASWRNDTML